MSGSQYPYSQYSPPTGGSVPPFSMNAPGTTVRPPIIQGMPSIPAAGVAAQAQPRYPMTMPPVAFPSVPGAIPPPSMLPVIPPTMHAPASGPINGSGGVKFQQELQQQSLKYSSYLTDANLRQPTLEEQLRTVFVGSIPAELDDFWLSRILKASSTIAGWVRVRDAIGKPKNFALVEFENPAALAKGFKVLSELEIPVVEVEEGEEVEDESKAERKAAKLLITCSTASQDLIDIQDIESLDSARKSLQDIMNVWRDPVRRAEERQRAIDRGEDDEDAEQDNNLIRGIALGGDDDLLDFPPEQRTALLKEIAAFRERATQRERERIRRDEELERQRLERIQAEKRRTTATTGSPAPPSISSKMRSSYGDAPSFQKDSGRGREDYDSAGEELSDEALEERRRDKIEDELEAKFIERERRYLREERARIAHAEREMRREEDEKERYKRARSSMLKKLEEWDDEVEEERRHEEYYRDRSNWIRIRAAFRSREAELDARDAAAERAENPDLDRPQSAAAMASSFLEQLNTTAGRASRESSVASEPRQSRMVPAKKEELRRDAQPVRVAFKKEEPAAEHKPLSISLSQPKAAPVSASKFKLALGGKKSEPPVRKPEVKAVLDDEEEPTETKRRKLIPLSYDK